MVQTYSKQSREFIEDLSNTFVVQDKLSRYYCNQIATLLSTCFQTFSQHHSSLDKLIGKWKDEKTSFLEIHEKSRKEKDNELEKVLTAIQLDNDKEKLNENNQKITNMVNQIDQGISSILHNS